MGETRNKQVEIISPGDQFREENNLGRLGMDVVREGFLEEVIMTQTPNGGEGARHADLCEEHSRQKEKHMRTVRALSTPLSYLLS